MHEGKYSRDFLFLRTFAYEETRLMYLTSGEKRDSPAARTRERQWAINAIGKCAQCLQTWCGNHDLYYCHWIAKSEEYVCCQLDAFELDSKVVNSLITEIF